MLILTISKNEIWSISWFNNQNKYFTVFRFLDNIQLASNDDDFTENESDKDKMKRNQSDKCVKLLTLHASKVYSL